MKKYFLLAFVVGCLSMPTLSLGITNVLSNGSFETEAAWTCVGCGTDQVAADLFATVSGAADGDRVVALGADMGIQQAVVVPTGIKRPVRLKLSYLTNGAFKVSVRDATTNVLYVRESVTATKDSASTWQTLFVTLPTSTAGQTVTITAMGVSKTTALDDVVLYRAAYPVARVTVYDATTREIIPGATVFFRVKESHRRVTLRRQSSGAESTSVITGALGKTPIVSVHGKPKKLQLCVQSGDHKRCTTAYDANYFAWDKSGDFRFYL